MTSDLSFGQWLKRRRQALGMTRDELARRVGYSVGMLRKVEGDERVPSLQLVELLAEHLAIAPEERTAFLSFARDDLTAEHAIPPIHPVALVSTPSLHPTNLPRARTSLIGRREEVAAVRRRLRDGVRLVTITGPGGVGKTRLATAVGGEVLEDFHDGVFFVNLAPVTDPTLVASSIAGTFDVRESPGSPLVENLKNYLREKDLLLVFDNFEQVLDAAPIVADLLDSSPRLKVLATSRAILHLRGEHEFAVPPLAMPDPRRLSVGPGLVPALLQYEAVRLFVDRAQAVQSDFAVTSANALALAEICHRLDGLPLAIELAAARIRLLTPQAMLARLDQRLKLLIGGPRDLPIRQQTLRNTIAWSCDLLNPAEQRLFWRLAVFMGGCTLEAVEAVCNADGALTLDVLDGVESLVAKSLLQPREEDDREPRFVMLETIREYALERLVESGEAEAIRRQHTNFFLALAEEARPKLKSRQQIGWLKRLEREHDNLRAALAWNTGERHDDHIGLRLAGALWPFWYMRGYLSEGRGWLEVVLAQSVGLARTQARAHALAGAGALAYESGDDARATSLLEESVRIWRELPDRRGLAYSLVRLGRVARTEGNYSAARSLLEESLAIQRELGNRWGIADALHYLGHVALEQGDFAAAHRLFDESLALFSEMGDRWSLAQPQRDLGRIALQQGNYIVALSHFVQSLVIWQELGDKLGITMALRDLGELAEYQGDYARAARLFGAVEARREATGERSDYDSSVASTPTALDREQLAATWAEGRAMTLEEAVTYALEAEGTEVR